MEASLLDLTRGLDRVGPAVAFHALYPEALEVEIEIVHDDEDEVVIEYVFEHAPIEDAFADPWFAAHDEDAEVIGEGLAPADPGRSVRAILGFGLAVALAAALHASTL